MILGLETNPVFTQNFADLESQEKRWISTFWHARRPYPRAAAAAASISTRPPSPTRPYSPSAPPSPSAPSEIHHFTLPEPIFTQDLRGNLQTWSLEDELKVMARVQAYFHVAHKVRITITDAMFA
jgi:hypothetical protein